MKKLLLISSFILLMACNQEKSESTSTQPIQQPVTNEITAMNLHEDFLVDPYSRTEEYIHLQPKDFNLMYNQGLNIIPQLILSNEGEYFINLFILDLNSGDNKLREPQILSIRSKGGEQITLPQIFIFGEDPYEDVYTLNYTMDLDIARAIIENDSTLYIGNKTTRSEIVEGEKYELKGTIINSLKEVVKMYEGLN